MHDSDVRAGETSRSKRADARRNQETLLDPRYDARRLVELLIAGLRQQD